MSNLRIPGPTPLPPEILSALSRQMISHRGKSYEEIHGRIVNNLKYFFQTENEIFLLTSSGMGGLEFAIVNFFSPGNTIVSFTCGEFGERWADVARNFGARVVQVKFPYGEAVDKNIVAKTLDKEKKIDGVLITHNETSIGVLNPVAEISSLVKKHKTKPLFLVDAISSLGAVDLPMDKIGIDVLVTASQKAWMSPPGLSMVSVSQRAIEKHANAKMPRYYFDLTKFRSYAQKNQTPATPAISTIFALDTSLELMKKEGKENIFKRHIKFRDYTREKIKKLKLPLFVEDRDASPTVTSIKVPAQIEAKAWLDLMKQKYQVILAGGMGEMKGKIIRIAHMGFVSSRDLDEAIFAVGQSFEEISKI